MYSAESIIVEYNPNQKTAVTLLLLEVTECIIIPDDLIKWKWKSSTASRQIVKGVTHMDG